LNLSKSRLLKHAATLGPLGFSPFAPGTLGTLAAMALLLLVHLSTLPYIALTLACIVLGILSSEAVVEALGRRDPSCVVIDEFAGYLVAVAFLPSTTAYLLAGFILFRVFDILKPPPIRGLQVLRGGLGIMADDLAAGLLTNVILQIWRTLNLTS